MLIVNPSCPHCDVELVWDDTIDNYFGGDIMIAKSIGHCPKCKREFQWEDIYIYDGYENFKEID